MSKSSTLAYRRSQEAVAALDAAYAEARRLEKRVASKPSRWKATRTRPGKCLITQPKV